MKSVEQAKQDYQKMISNSHIRFKCSYCHNDVVGDYSEGKRTMFEPKEVEHEVIDVQYDDNHKIVGQTTRMVRDLVSSDWKKDDYMFKCPICGSYEHLTGEQYREAMCDGTGRKTYRFELTDKEYAVAQEFLNEHRHPGRKRGAIGGGTEFTFMPTGLGDCVGIKCLLCGESKNLTDYDNW